MVDPTAFRIFTCPTTGWQKNIEAPDPRSKKQFLVLASSSTFGEPYPIKPHTHSSILIKEVRRWIIINFSHERFSLALLFACTTITLQNDNTYLIADDYKDDYDFIVHCASLKSNPIIYSIFSILYYSVYKMFHFKWRTFIFSKKNLNL